MEKAVRRMESSGGRRDIRPGNEDLCRLNGENERKERREKRKGEQRERERRIRKEGEGRGGFHRFPSVNFFVRPNARFDVCTESKQQGARVIDDAIISSIDVGFHHQLLAE